MKFTIGLWLSLVAIIGGVMVLRAQPVDWSADFGGLDYCGEQLCFAGIVVGQTRIEEARAILEPHREITPKTQIAAPTIDALIGNMQVSIVQFQNKGAIVNVNISYKPPLTLDKLILRFGKPCFVKIIVITTNSTVPGLGVRNNFFRVQLYYPSIIANVVMPVASENTRLEYGYPVDLTLTRKAVDCDRDDSQWQGFTTLSNYRAQRQP